MVILNIVQSCKNIITHIISVFNPDMGISIRNAQLEEKHFVKVCNKLRKHFNLNTALMLFLLLVCYDC